MKATELYRVVGVRADSTRMVIVDQVTKQQADRIKTLMDNETVFQSIEIETAGVSVPELDLKADCSPVPQA